MEWVRVRAHRCRERRVTDRLLTMNKIVMMHDGDGTVKVILECQRIVGEGVGDTVSFENKVMFVIIGSVVLCWHIVVASGIPFIPLDFLRDNSGLTSVSGEKLV